MFFKKALASFLLVIIFWSSSTLSASAATVSVDQNRVLLLSQIERLLAEVVRLQAILAARSVSASPAFSTSYTPYQATFFPLDFESIYLIQNSLLYNTGQSQGGTVREIDKKMFDLFSDVLGAENVTKYFKEWRVFQNSQRDLGAFVELISGTNKWIVGVNREGFSTTDTRIKKSFANLFVHEYSHVLFFEMEDFEKSFQDIFWTEADLRHEDTVSQTSSLSRFDVLSSYYEKNQSRFVSDYATINPQEDMAETFVYFVKEGRPSGDSVRDRKILAFYQNQTLVEARIQLRKNLQDLGLLN